MVLHQVNCNQVIIDALSFLDCRIQIFRLLEEKISFFVQSMERILIMVFEILLKCSLWNAALYLSLINQELLSISGTISCELA
jgi:hypothetical protein